MDREGGFIVLRRRLRSWPLWERMTALQRMVWVEMLLSANWRDSEVWHGAQRLTVKRGQLLHSERALAKGAAVSRKVVRTTVEKLLAEGAITRSPGGTDLERTWNDGGHETGPAKGPVPHIITIVNYNKYQDVPGREGPASGPSEAQGGPNEGPTRAPSEPEEPEEPEKLSSTAAAPAVGRGAALTLVALPEQPKKKQPKQKDPPDPRHAAVRALLPAVYAELRGAGDFPWGPAQAGALARLLKSIPDATVAEFEARWRRSLTVRNGTANPMQFFARWADLAPPQGVAADFKTQIDLSRDAANRF